MLSELLHRFSVFLPINQYRYVGFGSVYFGDFSLFHRDLGIEDMVTIEKQDRDEARVRFNVPYHCIEVKMGAASSRLLEIPWHERPSVVWLDYDYSLDAGVLADIETVATRLLAFSAIIVTVDARQEALEKPKTSDGRDIDEVRFEAMNPSEKLEEKVGAQHMTAKVRALSLRGDELAEAYRQMIANTIRAGLATRDTDFRYKQLVNFRYSDGHEMATVGGVVFEATELSAIAKLNTRSFRYYRPGSHYFRIVAPNLTYREIRELNRQLPTDDIDAINVPITPEDKRDYARIYRYFPSFTEAEV
jgi:hypothetical protein